MTGAFFHFGTFFPASFKAHCLFYMYNSIRSLSGLNEICL